MVRVHGVDVGETIRARIHEKFGRLKAEVIEFLAHSARRIELDCDNASICPGCSLRHLSPEHERHHKIESRKTRLEKYALSTPTWENLYASPRNAIRSRAVARAFAGPSGQLHLGMRAWTGTQVIDLHACPIQTDACRTLIELTEKALRRLNIRPFDKEDRSGHLRHVIVEAFAPALEDTGGPHSRIILALGDPHSPSLIPADFMADVPGLVVATDTLPFRGAGLISKPKALKGDGRIYCQLGTDHFRVSLGAWAPQTPSSVKALREAVIEWLEPQPNHRLIEVGCGVGTLSLPLGRRTHELIGIDMSRAAVEDAQVNAEKADMKNLRFITGRAEHSLRKLAGKQTPCDLALVHAMRKPMGHKAMAGLNALRPRKILYIAPQMGSFLEDFESLSGYEIQRIGSIDQTPATGHLLTLCLLVSTHSDDLPASTR